MCARRITCATACLRGRSTACDSSTGTCGPATGETRPTGWRSRFSSTGWRPRDRSRQLSAAHLLPADGGEPARAAGGEGRRDRRAGGRDPPGPAPGRPGTRGGGGGHARGAQRDLVHAVLVLSAHAAGASARLVQVAQLPLARGARAAHRARGARPGGARRRADPGARLHRRNALYGAAAAPARDRGLERRAPRFHRDARLHDRRRRSRGDSMTSKLFTPLQLGGVVLPNRIVVSPMCQYSADDGCMSDWHIVHLGSLACSGAGLVVVEKTGVTREGRITHGCTGIYSDHSEAAMARVVQVYRGITKNPIGIQLGHAGRKASAHFPWHGGKPLAAHQSPWQTVAPSPVPFGEGWHVPGELTGSA